MPYGWGCVACEESRVSTPGCPQEKLGLPARCRDLLSPSGRLCTAAGGAPLPWVPQELALRMEAALWELR